MRIDSAFLRALADVEPVAPLTPTMLREIANELDEQYRRAELLIEALNVSLGREDRKFGGWG